MNSFQQILQSIPLKGQNSIPYVDYLCNYIYLCSMHAIDHLPILLWNRSCIRWKKFIKPSNNPQMIYENVVLHSVANQNRQSIGQLVQNFLQLPNYFFLRKS